MAQNKNFIFCGGGSGGHVMPALTLYKYLNTKIPEGNFISIGSATGIEKEVFTNAGLSYFAISTGKLRRYFSWQNFLDVLRIFKGIIQAFFILLRWKKKESIVIATGGFVTVPVVFAAWLQGKKILVHEQTTRVGLANKICSYFATDVIVTFEESLKYFPPAKVQHLGYPLRSEIFNDNFSGVKIKGKEISSIDRPILFLTGGGNGSKLLNDSLAEIMPQIKDIFYIVHQCGKNYEEELLKSETDYYKVFGFVGDEMIALMRSAKVVISRSGAGTVVELMAIGKPSIFIPLKIAQKNEQYHNAMSAHKMLGSIVIKEDDLTGDILLRSIRDIQCIDKKSGVKNNPTEAIGNLILG